MCASIIAQALAQKLATLAVLVEVKNLLTGRVDHVHGGAPVSRYQHQHGRSILFRLIVAQRARELGLLVVAHGDRKHAGLCAHKDVLIMILVE